jgi:hypothetical protein
MYKDPGGPAQLGTRDWAGLKGHIDDRNLACSLASEGRSEALCPARGEVRSGPDRDCAQFSSRDVQFPPFWTQRQPLHKFSARVLGALEVRGALAL